MEHFPTALGVDDWISRVETVLAGFGFTGDNSIGECCGWGGLAGRWGQPLLGSGAMGAAAAG